MSVLMTMWFRVCRLHSLQSSGRVYFVKLDPDMLRFYAYSGCLLQLKYLSLANNRLTGTLLPSWGALTQVSQCPCLNTCLTTCMYLASKPCLGASMRSHAILHVIACG